MYLLRGKNEPFVNEAIFNEVEIPDASKDPYYQFIKNIDFPCMCGEGKEMNFNNECVPICPAGQTRFTNNVCYPPCPAGQSRHTNTVCYPPCPLGEFRDPAGVCQCIQQQPLYDLSSNYDGGANVGGTCVENPEGGWPKWAEDSKIRCNNTPSCKAYNLVHRGGVWGDKWGSCMKTTATPTRVPLTSKIDYYTKIETVRNSSGVCVSQCPPNKTKDANGICQWNPCPAEQTRDPYGDCQWNACLTGQTRDANGVCQWPPCPTGQIRFTDNICYPPCPTGKTRDANGVCQWPPCPANSTVNETTGQCTCNSGYEVANAFSYYTTSDKTSVSRNQRCDRPCAPGVIRDLAGVCGGSATINTGLNFNFGGR
jgi:hypothetical protein